MEIGFELIDLWKLGLAMVVGGVIGAEREFRDKAAGFRTNILICTGATLFTIFSFKMAGEGDDATRIAANIVTGIGFLGAGAILREGSRILGLTTASTIWIVASLGMGIGTGHYILVGLGTVATLVTLWVLPTFEHRLGQIQETREYRVVCEPDPEHFARLERLFRDAGLTVRTHKQMKQDDRMVCTWHVIGTQSQHDEVTRKLFSDEAVIEFEV